MIILYIYFTLHFHIKRRKGTAIKAVLSGKDVFAVLPTVCHHCLAKGGEVDLMSPWKPRAVASWIKWHYKICLVHLNVRARRFDHSPCNFCLSFLQTDALCLRKHAIWPVRLLEKSRDKFLSTCIRFFSPLFCFNTSQATYVTHCMLHQS